jgi:hypothetical protein
VIEIHKSKEREQKREEAEEGVHLEGVHDGVPCPQAIVAEIDGSGERMEKKLLRFRINSNMDSIVDSLLFRIKLITNLRTKIEK